MAVPFTLICVVVAVVVAVLVTLYIVYKILKRKRKANEDSSGSGAKNGDYKKLEEGEEALGPDDPTGTTSDNKLKKKQKGKGKGKRKGKRNTKGLADGTEDIEVHTDAGNLMTSNGGGGLQEVLMARLQISATYLSSSTQLLVTIHKGEHFPSDNLTTAFEVRITLLPAKIQRFKTKSHSSVSPDFDELFTFSDVSAEDMEFGSLRARVYKLKGRKRSLVGELTMELSAALGLEGRNVDYQWREVTPAQEILDDISDTVLLTDPETALMAPSKETVPMLLVSLQHKCITGKLTVEIIKARHMRTISTQKAPETFVQIALFNSNGIEIANAKTAVCKGNFHPVFEESFYFPVIEFELPNLTVVFSVFGKKFRSKELIGSFGIGRESTGEREQLHWDEMIDVRGEAIKGWYTLGQ